MNSFGVWLLDEMNKRNWSQHELARRANVSQGSIGNVIRGDRNPGPELCEAIARALGYPDAIPVFRAAGLLNQLPPEDSEREIFMANYNALTPENKERFRRMVKDELRHQQEQEEREQQALELERAKRRKQTGPLPKMGG